MRSLPHERNAAETCECHKTGKNSRGTAMMIDVLLKGLKWKFFNVITFVEGTAMGHKKDSSA